MRSFLSSTSPAPHARVLAIAAICAAACKTPGATAARAPAGTPSAPTSPLVTLMTPAGEQTRVQVELAATPDARTTGLMNRDHLADDRGMLFVFPREAAQTFWMKNTLLSLDMIFIRADMTVAGVVSRAEPLTLTPRGVAAPSQYVLEVAGGFAEAHHITAGDRVKLDDVPATTE